MKARLLRSSVALAALFAALGCAGPAMVEKPAPPGALEGRGFQHAGPETAAAEVLAERWWDAFGDPRLDELVRAAVLGNLDLKRAAARVAEAEALLVRSRADRMPNLDLATTGQRARTVNPLADPINNRYVVSLGVRYEADLWGRLSQQTEAATQDLAALHQDRLRAYHTLAANVAGSYIELRLAGEQAALSERTIANDRARLGLVQERYRRGLAPALDVFEAQRTIAQAEARVFTFRQAQEQARHRLNVLLGRYPADLEGERVQPGALLLPDPVPVGLPLQLLERRPDLRAAEHRYFAASARTEAARVGRYPRLALTGDLGRTSSELADLTLGANTFWTLLANLTHPLYNAGANDAVWHQAEARRDGALLEYGAVVLAALREVEDALVVEREQRLRLEALDRTVELARQTLESSEARYLRGLDNLIPSLNARDALLRAEIDRLDTRRNLLLNRATLYLALGGTWGDEKALAGADTDAGQQPGRNP